MKTTKLPTTAIILLLFVSAATALNVTRLLERDPNFSTFSDYLRRTKVDLEVNSRSSVTVLAVSNDKIGDLAGKPADVFKTIMKSHVILDYFDILKLEKLRGKPTIVTTLFQTTGTAIYQQGYLNITKNINGEIVFASAVHGAPRNAVLLGSVAAQPFNISILSVSHYILTPGVEAYTFSPPSQAGALAPSKAKEQPPAPSSEAPATSEDDATLPSESPADAPADSPADSPADVPTDEPADSPDSDAPISEAPAADAPAADAAADDNKKSASSRNFASSTLGFLVVLASFLADY